MPDRSTATALLLALTLAACASPAASTLATPSAAPTASGTRSASPTPVDPGPSATTAPATKAPATARTPRPTRTPLPIPPKPSGVSYEERSEGYCDPDDPRAMCSIDDLFVTVSWKAPRTRDTTIRVYGVTKCFGTDASGAVLDGVCLRTHTALPSSVRVLLGKAPASKGTLTIHMVPSQSLAETVKGVPVYSIVLAAYNADGGHSIFAIAETIEYCLVVEEECGE